MNFHVFIQGATGSSPGLERGQAAAVTQFEGYFTLETRPWEANTILVMRRRFLSILKVIEINN